MKIFTTKERVMRYDFTHEFKSFQCLERYYFLFGIKIFKIELDRENIPSYAIIANACFGDCSGWTSKFMPFGKGGWKA